MDNIRYLRQRGVVPLLNELVAEVLREKPADPLVHLISTLTEIQASVTEERGRILERRRQQKKAAAGATGSAGPHRPAIGAQQQPAGCRLPPLDRGALLAAIGSERTPLLSAAASVASREHLSLSATSRDATASPSPILVTVDAQVSLRAFVEKVACAPSADACAPAAFPMLEATLEAQLLSRQLQALAHEAVDAVIEAALGASAS